MSKEIKKVDQKDVIFDSINAVAERAQILLRLYPQATKQIFKAYELEIGKDSWNKKSYKPEDLRDIAIAELEVDILKNKHE